MSNTTEENFEENNNYIEVSTSKKKSATVDLYNSIRSRNVKSLQKAINDGADKQAILHIGNKIISPFAYIFTHGTLSREGERKVVDLDNNNGILIRMMTMLINSGFDPIYKTPLSFINYEDRETSAGKFLIDSSLKVLSKTPESLKDYADNKGNKWLMYAIQNKENALLSQFFKSLPQNDSGLPWVFDQDGSQQSMLIKALETSDKEIFNIIIADLTSENIDCTVNGDGFTLLDEILVSIDNLPRGKIASYTEAAQTLINLGAKVKEDRKYGVVAEKVILENKTNKNISPILKNSF